MSFCAEFRREAHPWYAIRVRSKCESAVSSALRGKGYEEFLPLCRPRRRWSDRCVDLQLPLFPGYLFCRLDVTGRLLLVVSTPGVVSIVGAGKSPVAVSDEEIAAVRMVIQSGLPAQPWPFVSVGCRVYIEHGPLAGIEGIVISVDRKHKLNLSMPLNKSLPRRWLDVQSRPAGKPKRKSRYK
jgi:transcription antitermination factor NusG